MSTFIEERALGPGGLPAITDPWKTADVCWQKQVVETLTG
jgi:hypothetical protein